MHPTYPQNVLTLSRKVDESKPLGLSPSLFAHCVPVYPYTLPDSAQLEYLLIVYHCTYLYTHLPLLRHRAI